MLKQLENAPIHLQVFRPRSHGGSSDEGVNLPLTTDTDIANISLRGGRGDIASPSLPRNFAVEDSTPLGNAMSGDAKPIRSGSSGSELLEGVVAVKVKSNKRRKALPVTFTKNLTLLTHEYVVVMEEECPMGMRLVDATLYCKRSGHLTRALLVEHMKEDGLAKSMGIHTGDCVFSINGKKDLNATKAMKLFEYRPAKLQMLR